MNKFTWGNLNHDKARIGPETRRSAEQHRLQFMYLAQALIAEGKKDSAVQVLDRGLEVFPYHKIGYDWPVVYFAINYFRAGETEKGLALANQMVDVYEANLRYYERFPAKYRKFLESYMQEAINVFGALHQNIPRVDESCKGLLERLDKLLSSRGVQA